MVKIIFLEKNHKAISHKELAEKLRIQELIITVDDSRKLIKLLDTEKPEMVIIDDKLPVLKKTKMIEYLNKEADKVTFILIERINGTDKIRELIHTESGLQEKAISENDLLEKVRLLKLQKATLLVKNETRS